jgi:hypothetical protein
MKEDYLGWKALIKASPLSDREEAEFFFNKGPGARKLFENICVEGKEMGRGDLSSLRKEKWTLR